jgi:hypothetical protein
VLSTSSGNVLEEIELMRGAVRGLELRALALGAGETTRLATKAARVVPVHPARRTPTGVVKVTVAVELPIAARASPESERELEPVGGAH